MLNLYTYMKHNKLIKQNEAVPNNTRQCYFSFFCQVAPESQLCLANSCIYCSAVKRTVPRFQNEAFAMEQWDCKRDRKCSYWFFTLSASPSTSENKSGDSTRHR